MVAVVYNIGIVTYDKTTKRHEKVAIKGLTTCLAALTIVFGAWYPTMLYFHW
jgi:hypothetical protein